MKAQGVGRSLAPCFFMLPSRPGRNPGIKHHAMCYHIALVAAPEELGRRYGRKTGLIGDFRPVYRICAFSHVAYPIVTGDEQMHFARWGLIPYWIRKADQVVTVRNQTVNAPAETIFEHASFRLPVRRRRCLVPVSGFFGWRQEQGRKTPYYVTVRERPLFSLAGVYDYWTDAGRDERVMTYSVITTEANPLMRYVNNASGRMPVILRSEDEARWLDPDLSDKQIAAMLKPYPEQGMASKTVRHDFIRKDPGDPTILVPAQA